MMTRHCTRRHLPRSPHPSSPKRPSLRYNPLYYLRSILLFRLLLSLLPLKPSSNPRTRGLLTSSRHHPPKPTRCTSPQHLCSSGLRSLYYLSPSQPYRRQSQTHTPITTYYNLPRSLFYTTTSIRILRNPIYNLWRGLWLYILHSHRIPRPPRHYRLYLPNRMPSPTTKISLYIQSPLRIWSRRLILTLRRRCLTLPICIYLLMRILFF